MFTVWEAIPDDMRRKWDQHHYVVFAPVSLDDEAKVTIRLVNRDGSEMYVEIPLLFVADGHALTQVVSRG